jgi:ABC-type transport system substrate-binding protein
VAQAQALLQAAGQSGLSFRIQLPDLDPLRSYGQLVAEQLSEAGFQPHPLVQDAKGWQTAFTAGDFEAVVFEIGGLDTPDIGLRLHTAQGVDGRYSLWGYSNPVYDAAVRTALSQLNPADRARESRKAQRLLLDDVPAMFPIAAPLEQARVANRIQGYEYGAYDFNLAWLAAGWSATGPATTPTPPGGTSTP